MDIQGAGGKSGGGGGKTPTEAPDSLHSVSRARILDAVSEGPIRGFKHGATNFLQDVYYNRTPVQNINGSFNFTDVVVDSRLGLQVQDYIAGFADVENEIADGASLIFGTPYSITITHTYLSAVRVTLAVSALSSLDIATGNVNPYKVDYQIELSTDGGSYATAVTGSFSGKTTTPFNRSHRIDLPPATTSWTLRISRLTATAGSGSIADLTSVVSHTEVIDGKFTYPNTALVGSTVNAKQFPSIPVRAFDLYGRIIRVPSNYNPITRVYTGVWDGTFQSAWTNNPAWIYFDMATNDRFGLGAIISDPQIDKGALYNIGQYCDGYVPTGIKARGAFTTGSVALAAVAPNQYTRTTGSFLTDGFIVGDEINATGFATAGNNGRGIITAVTATTVTIDVDHALVADAAAAGRTLAVQDFTEPRFTCNVQLQVAEDAYKLMQDLATVFRGISYWAGGMIVPVCDMPQSPVYTYTNANVIDGQFVYSGSAKSARHTVAIVSWSDDTDFGNTKFEYVFDDVGVARLGIIPVSVAAFACGSQSQAHRVGRHLLLTERVANNIVTFSIGLDGTFVMPGKVVQIADSARAGRRTGGRIGSTGTNSTTTIFIDAQPSTAIVAGNTLYVTHPDGTVESRSVTAVSGVQITVSPPYSQVPQAHAPWAIETAALKLQQFRILSLVENPGASFAISALVHDESIFSAVDFGTQLTPRNISGLPQTYVLAPASIALSTYVRATNISATTVLTAEWPKCAGATSYAIQFKHDSGDWTPPIIVGTTSYDYDNATVGLWSARVSALTSAGIQSSTTTSGTIAVTLPTGLPSDILAAQTAATAAQASADAANASLADIASDNLLTPNEKPVVIRDRDQIIAEQAGIDTQAATYGVTTQKTAYDSAVTALTSFLATLTTTVLWSNLADNTTIVGATFRQKFLDVYAARQVLLARIADVVTYGNLAGSGVNIEWDEFCRFTAAQASVTSATSPLAIFTSGSSLATVVDAATPSGFSLQATTAAAVALTDYIYLAPAAGTYNVNITGNRKYLFSFYAKCSVAGHLIRPALRGALSIDGVDIALSTVYVRYSVVFDCSSIVDGNINLAMYTNNSGVAGRLVSFDRLMLEPLIGAVTTPSAWVPGQTGHLVAIAQASAATAQTNATTALNGIVDISNDNLLSPNEKPPVIRDRDQIVAEQSGIDAQATAFAITTEKTTYDSAVTSLTSYLATLTSPYLWSDLTGNTTIAGGTFRTYFLNVYSARQTLLNKIATVAKAIADGKTKNTTSTTAPSSPSVDDLWYNPNLMEERRWTGAAWVVSPTAAQVSGGANFIANPNFTANQIGTVSGAALALNAPCSDGWVVDRPETGYGVQVAAVWLAGTFRSVVGKPAAVANGTTIAPEIHNLFPIAVKPGSTYMLDYVCTQTYDSALTGGVTATSGVSVLFYNAAGTFISQFDLLRARAAAQPSPLSILAPSNAATAVVYLYTKVVNGSGAAWTHAGAYALQTDFTSISLIRKADVEVAGSGVRIGDNRNLNQLMVGNGRASVPTVITYTSAPTTATISVAAFTMLVGSVSISYGAKSVGTTGTAGTNVTYYLYLDDPGFTGTGTLVATTTGSQLYTSDGRVYVGQVTVSYPASGTGGGGGGRDPACVCVGMFLLDDLIAAEASVGSLIDCLDLPTSDAKFKRRINAISFSDAECVRLTTSEGAVWEGSAITPYDLLDGGTLRAEQMIGQLVVTDRGIEAVTAVTSLGLQPVAHVSVNGVSYAAGRDAGHRIYSHNVLKP